MNDYRNLVVAEGMKVLGFVNRFSRGVLQVEDSLEENGNGLPLFNLGISSAFMVTEYKSRRGEELEKNAIEQGFIMKQERTGSSSNTDTGNQKLTQEELKTDTEGQKLTSNEPKTDMALTFPTTTIRDVLMLIRQNPKIKYSQMEDNLGITERTIARAIDWLKGNGYINPQRSKVKGVWQLTEPETTGR